MIKGLKPSLAEAGKIKIGGLGAKRKARSGRDYMVPEKWDHFKVTTTNRDNEGRLEVDAALMAALPKDTDGQVRAIPVVLHSDVIDDVFPTTYAMYGGRQLLCRGDGETAERWPSDKGRRTSNKPEQCPCPCPLLDEKKCKPNGLLRCSIVAPGQAVAGAIHAWRTTSIISIQRMLGSIQQIFETCGTIRGLPLILRVTPVTVSPQGKTSTVHCCHLELRAENLLAAQQQALQLAQMRHAVAGDLDTPQVLALLPAPAADTETPEEQAEVAAEFYHEPEPTEEGRHQISEGAAAGPGPATAETLLAHIADVPDTAVSETAERWLRNVITTCPDQTCVDAAAAKLEIVVTNRACAAAERDRAHEEPPHDPETGEVTAQDELGF